MYLILNSEGSVNVRNGDNDDSRMRRNVTRMLFNAQKDVSVTTVCSRGLPTLPE